MSERKKLLIATTVSSTINAFLLPYADHFRAAGWTVDAMASDASKRPELSRHFDRLFDIAWSRDPLNRCNSKEAPHQVCRVAKEGKYDIVHVHTPVAAFVTRMALSEVRHSLKTKIVYTAHGFHFYTGGHPVKNAIFRFLERIAGRWTDKLIVINSEDYHAAKKYQIVPEANIVYMPGIGLDFSVYDRSKVTSEEIAGLRAELGLAPEDVLLLMIARLSVPKRHRDLVLALAATKNLNVHAAFAGDGDGELKAKLKALAQSKGVASRIHFLGHRDDIQRLIAASKATVLPSEHEGLPRSCMESICLGVPVIGSSARGVRDVLQPGRGLVYPVGDVFALRDAIDQIIAEDHPPVEPDPQWEVSNIIAAHERLYNEMLLDRQT